MLPVLVSFDRHTQGLLDRRFVGRVLACMLSVLCMTFWLPSGAFASNSEGSTTVTANVAEVIEVLEWPSEEYSLGNLMPGDEVIIGPLQFEVRSNVPWEIFISSDSPNGELREYNLIGSYYVLDGAATSNSIQWRWGEAGAWSALSQAGASLFGTQDATGDQSKTFTFYLGFLPSFNDARLTDPDREYRVVLTYTVGARY